MEAYPSVRGQTSVPRLADLEATSPKMPPTPLRAVFLDLGNTLVTERSSRVEIYASGGRAHGLTVEAPEMARRMAEAREALPVETAEGYRYSDAWFRAFQRRIFVEGLGLAESAFEALSRDLFERFQRAETFRILPGARELLADLRARGLAVGLISNWSERLPLLLRALDLERAFDVVLGSAHERLEKPATALFRRALERVGARPEEALHAGDDLECDAGGALSAGLSAVLVRPSLAGLPDPPPCPVVRDLVELRGLIHDRLAAER